MDKETQYRLDKIGKHISKIAKDITKQVPSEHYAITMDIVNNSRLSAETRKLAMRSIENGSVQRYDTVTDSKKSRELDERMGAMIQKEVRDGNIKLAKDDNFTRGMRDKLK